MGPQQLSLELLILVGLFCIVTPHVRLTYPQARYIDIDFLDNVRTRGPCGVPAIPGKDTITELYSGMKFNVTWHLSYAHRGGYQLQLLEGGKVVHWLTPEGQWLGMDDVTSQSYLVEIPASYTCDQCTLRLLRQASEWSTAYQFWSCAEVSIENNVGGDPDCSGQTVVNGKCKCDHLYSGTYCQYKDDCVNDGDCNRHGKCIDIDATSFPKKQCFCEKGWFGEQCQNESPVKSIAPTNARQEYQIKQLNDDYMMYYKVVKSTRQDQDELEVILEAKSTTWLGIGWRPLNVGDECKNFPNLHVARDTDGRPINEPTGEPNGEPEGESKGEPEGESKGEPEGESKGEPTGEPEGESKGEPEAESKGEPTGEPEGESKGEPEAESKGEPTGEPEGESKGEPEAESKGEPTGEPEGESKGEPEVESKGEPTGEPEAESKGEPEGEPTSEPKGEPEGEPTGEPEGESKGEPEGESKGEPTGEPEGESKGEPTGEPESKPEGKPEPKSESETEPEAESTSEPEPESETEPEAEGNKNNLHHMDCTDIIVGAAQGSLSRILDYYTRDRSTPRPDAIYSGTQSLTAAIGEEKDGVTTILFRRKLTATEKADYTISKGSMHLIYAKGQEMGNYIHSPYSGIERGESKDPNFYRPDELKYHGHGGQRGADRINFLAEPVFDPCVSEFKMPSGCAGDACTYHAKWVYDVNSDTISFTIRGKQNQDQWIGIGFGETRNMENVDVVIGFIDNNGRQDITDRYIDGRYSRPAIDDSQDLEKKSISYFNGMYTMTFTRKRSTGDPKDHVFDDNKCYYFMYPIGGGPVRNGMINRHTNTPVRTDSKICVKKCEVLERLVYLSVKTNEQYDPEFQNLNSPEAQAFTKKFVPALLNEMKKKVPEVKNIIIKALRPGSVWADMEVEVLTDGSDAGYDATLKKVEKVTEEELSDGTIDTINVDQNSLYIGDMPIRAIPSSTPMPSTPKVKTSTASPSTTDTPMITEGTPKRKMQTLEIVLIVVICVLVFVALVVLMVRCIESNRKGEEGHSHGKVSPTPPSSRAVKY